MPSSKSSQTNVSNNVKETEEYKKKRMRSPTDGRLLCNRGWTACVLVLLLLATSEVPIKADKATSGPIVASKSLSYKSVMTIHEFERVNPMSTLIDVFLDRKASY